LIKVNMESDNCMYVSTYTDATVLEWKKKTDSIYDILELLDDDTVKKWEAIYNGNQDTYNYEEDDE
ncbi:MAG: hypothetical protein JST75_08780, partial [Bacteroidetes bacterium]|nr:hypothetical protein [Bacteroidota bacterium]